MAELDDFGRKLPDIAKILMGFMVIVFFRPFNFHRQVGTGKFNMDHLTGLRIGASV